MLVKEMRGFTLIELMIVLTIIGIVTVVAYPSYQGMIANSARGAVQADLLALASVMERHSAINFTYKGAAVSNANTGKPAIFNGYSPASELEVHKRYDLTIDTVSVNGESFLLKAVPVTGTSVGGTGSLFIYSDGRKAWDKDADGFLEAREYCWHC